MFNTYIVWAGIIGITSTLFFAASVLVDILRRLERFHADYRKVNDLDAREEMEDLVG